MVELVRGILLSAVMNTRSVFHSTAPRSSMAWKHHIDVGAGVIDADYRGNVGVVLFNLAQRPYEGNGNSCSS